MTELNTEATTPRGDNDYVTEFATAGSNGLERLLRALENGQVDDCRKTRIKIGEGPNTRPCMVLAPTRRIQTSIPAVLFWPTLRLRLLCAEF
jgi:hypothetical protein